MNKLLTMMLLLSCDCSAGTKNVLPAKDVQLGWVHLQLIGNINQQSVEPLINILNTAPPGVVSGIIIEINSGGGVADDAFLLAKAIENSKVPVACIVDGDGLSAAFYVLQSCPRRIMTKRSILMTHNPSVAVNGNATTLLETSKILTASQEAMLQHNARRLSISADELRALISTSTLFMHYRDAKRFGAVDIITGSVKEYISTLK